jgi:hypothetical protein
MMAQRKRRTSFRTVVVCGERELPKDQGKAVVLDMSRSFREAQERNEQIRAMARRPTRGDSVNVRFAMQAIEHRIVKGLWTLEISLPPEGRVGWKGRMGIDYFMEREDKWAAAVAGGGWLSNAPSPAPPSTEEIDAALEAKKWIEFLPEQQARLLATAALSKRGDRSSRVNWEKVKERLLIPDSTPLRTLRDRYDQALRYIVAELTLARLA